MPKVQQRPSNSLTAFEKYQELNTRQVCAFLGVTDRTTLWRYAKEGKVPKPRYLKPGKPIWRLGELLDHTHALMKEYDDEPRGFRGDGAVQDAQAMQGGSSLADKLRERLGIKG